MTTFALVLWEIFLWGLLGLGLVAVTAIWLFIAFAVLRTTTEFIKAYKATKNLDLDEDQESW